MVARASTDPLATVAIFRSADGICYLDTSFALTENLSDRKVRAERKSHKWRKVLVGMGLLYRRGIVHIGQIVLPY